MSEQKTDKIREEFKTLSNSELLQRDASLYRGGLPRQQYRVEILPDDVLSIEIDSSSLTERMQMQFRLPSFEETVAMEEEISARKIAVGARAAYRSDLAQAIFGKFGEQRLSLQQLWCLVRSLLRPDDNPLSPSAEEKALAVEVLRWWVEVDQKLWNKEQKKMWKELKKLWGEPFEVPAIGRKDGKLVYDLLEQGLIKDANEYIFANNIDKQEYRRLAEYKERLKRAPNDATTRNNLGVSLYKLKKHEEAEAELREALRIKPSYAEVHRNLGLVLGVLGNHEEAEAEFREAVRIKPDYAEAHSLLGVLLARQEGRAKEAEAEYREALRIDPSDAASHGGLADLLSKMGRQEEAKEELRTGIKIFEKHGRADDVKKAEELLKRFESDDHPQGLQD